eukprot:13763113-Alexandrium_andersonii.AAC.1
MCIRDSRSHAGQTLAAAVTSALESAFRVGCAARNSGGLAVDATNATSVSEVHRSAASQDAATYERGSIDWSNARNARVQTR